ncbi:MAG: hypothetical protein IPM29_29315 [Planctomycetes bacterium]|nr:hypothetical protein [Planctomycetota bacterium]
MTHHVRTVDGEIYVYRVDHGDWPGTSLVLVSVESANATGAFIVKPGGTCEPGDDLPGFAINPARRDGLWPDPPREALLDATALARASAGRHSS